MVDEVLLRTMLDGVNRLSCLRFHHLLYCLLDDLDQATLHRTRHFKFLFRDVFLSLCDPSLGNQK